MKIGIKANFLSEIKKRIGFFNALFLYQLTLTISFMKSNIYEANIVFHCE